MLIKREGNVFEQNLDVVCHQANCRGTMGSGIALEVRNKYPEAFKADRNYPIPLGRGRLGLYSSAEVAHADGHHFIICNLYGQDNYKGPGPHTSVPHLRHALELAMDSLSHRLDFDTLKIGMPYLIGCDRAKGDWKEVSKMLEEVSSIYNKDIYLYEYNPK